MQDNPHPLLDSEPTSTTVKIVDRNRLVLPDVCVACGGSPAPLREYKQDHRPIILPGIGFVRTTQVALPYCDHDWTRFQMRFFRLRMAQRLGYAAILVPVILTGFSPLRKRMGLPPDLSSVEWILIAGVFSLLVLSIFVVKPFLYDAFVVVSGRGMEIRGGHVAFRENVLRANQGCTQ